MRLPEKHNPHFRRSKVRRLKDANSSSQLGEPDRLHSNLHVVEESGTSGSGGSPSQWAGSKTAAQLSIAPIEPAIPQFTSPQFHFGQMVRTTDGLSGYISGLLFYPDTQSWEYSIYLTHSQNGAVSGTLNEVWYTSKELTIDNDS